MADDEQSVRTDTIWNIATSIDDADVDAWLARNERIQHLATQEPLTQEKALVFWTEYQRLISVGAYSERSAEDYENNTWPEDGVEESVFNLENWAARRGLEFEFNHDNGKWSLVGIEQGHDDVGGYE